MSLPHTWKEVCASKAAMLGLKRYAFRREYHAARLATAGFSNIELIDSFDGFHEDVEGTLKTLGLQFHSEIGLGHIGCFVSHFRIWKQMVDENIPYRIIFEDDALGHLDLPNGLGQRFWDATPKQFDIVYVGNMMNQNDPALNDSNALVVKVPTYTTHAYIITLEGAKKLLYLTAEICQNGQHLTALDIQMIQWQIQGELNWHCWNGTWIQKCFPTFDEGLPWQAFPDIILPQKDTGLFWQNMRVGTTLDYPTLQLTIPQYGR